MRVFAIVVMAVIVVPMVIMIFVSVMFIMVFVVMLVMSIILAMRIVMIFVIVMRIVLVLVMMIFVMFAMVFIMVLIFVSMTVMIFVVIFIFAKNRLFAELKQLRAFSVQKFQRVGIICKRINRAFKPRGQIFTDPDDQVCILQCSSLGRAQRIPVGGCALLHQQCRLSNALHDACHQGMNRGDIGYNSRLVGVHLRGQQARSREGAIEHESLHVII
jgi:hypothetical protein